MTELHKKIIQWSFQWHSVAVFGITPKQIAYEPHFFLYQLQIWNTTYVDIWLSFYSNFGFLTIFLNIYFI